MTNSSFKSTPIRGLFRRRLDICRKNLRLSGILSAAPAFDPWPTMWECLPSCLDTSR